MQKWKVYLTFESEGNILMESKLYILEENEMKNRLEEIRKERGIRQEELARALEVSRYFGMAIEDIFIYEEGTE